MFHEVWNKLRGMKCVVITLSALVLFTGCSSSPPTESSSPPTKEEFGLLGSIQLWGENFQRTGEGNCKGTLGNNFENKAPLVLVGPDNSEISATSLQTGYLVQTDIDRSEVTNYGDGEVCYFRFLFSFETYPTVSTYRLKFRDGTISSVSWPRSYLLEYGDIGMAIGADYKN